MTIQSGTLGLGAQAATVRKGGLSGTLTGWWRTRSFFSVCVFFSSPVIKPVTASEKYPGAPA